MDMSGNPRPPSDREVIVEILDALLREEPYRDDLRRRIENLRDHLRFSKDHLLDVIRILARI